MDDCLFCKIIKGDIPSQKVYEDEKVLGKGKRSMAYTIMYRHPERTLTDDEVNKIQEKIRQELAQKLGVELR